MPTHLASISEADRKRVNDAVAAAEKWTETAILPVVVARSAGYERAEGLLGLVTAALVISISYVLSGPPPWAVLLGVLVASFGAGMALGRCRDDLRCALVSRARARTEVAAGAEAALADRRLRHADRGNALLLYVSLLEKRAVVAADARVRGALGDVVLQQVEADLTAAVGRGAAASGLVGAVETVAPALACELPRPAALIDERPNELVMRT